MIGILALVKLAGDIIGQVPSPQEAAKAATSPAASR